MSRLALTSLVLLLLTPMPALAQESAPDSENGRYAFSRVEDGYLRLDQRSGQVSLCNRRSLGWACYPVPDERTALEEEIARLQKDNAALKKEMLARGIALPGTQAQADAAKPDSAKPDSARPEPGFKLPPDPDLDRAMAYMERIWKRLIEMIGRLQRSITTQL